MAERTSEARGGSRELALLAVGVLLALTLGFLRSACGSSSALASTEDRVRYWAADRDGDHVFGLGEELLLRARKQIRRPLRVAGRVDGGAWILHAMGARDEPHGLVRINEWGATGAVATLGEPLDLATWRGRDALVIERGSGRGGLDRVLRFDASGRATGLFEAAGLRCLVVRGDEVLLGDARGGVRQLSLASGEVGVRRVPCGETPVLQLAACGSGAVASEANRGWWLLAGDHARTLTRLGSDLEPRWSMGTYLEEAKLVASRAEEGIWLAGSRKPRLRFYGERGRLHFQREPSLPGLGRGVLGSGGEVLFAAPGALLRFDRFGKPRPGQGGFRFLVDVSAVPAREAVPE